MKTAPGFMPDAVLSDFERNAYIAEGAVMFPHETYVAISVPLLCTLMA
jgi:hypothetical protein